MKFNYLFFIVNLLWILQSVQPGLGLGVLAMLNDFSASISENLYIGYQNLKCPFGDCCNDYWIPNDISSNWKHLPHLWIIILNNGFCQN